MDGKQSQPGRRILKVALFLLLVCGVFFLLLQVRDAQQAAFNSTVKCQLGQVALGEDNYQDLNGSSVFEAAREQDISWRELMANSFDEWQETIKGTGSDRTVPSYLRTRKPPSLAWFEADNAVPSDYLTCLHAIRLSEKSEKNEPVWLIAYVPQRPIQWLSKDDLSLEAFESVLHSDTKQRISCLISQEGRTVQRDRLFKILEAARAGETVEIISKNR